LYNRQHTPPRAAAVLETPLGKELAVIGTLLFPFLLLGGLAAVIVGTLVVAILLFRGQRKQAARHGYPSLSAYLRSAPQTDQEKQDATDLALKGLVICFLGLIFPPLLLVGLFPFFYGARKVAYASMGLGLVDDANHARD
jgi:hypothetical protein